MKHSKNFLKLKKLITTITIPRLFWIGVLIYIPAGIVLIKIGTVQEDHIDAIKMVLAGIACFIFVPIVLRLLCELLSILFDIHDTLADITKQSRSPEQQGECQS